MTALAAVTAFVVAWWAVRLIERRAPALGLIDLPNDRSSHVVPRPRGGGLGVIGGVVAGVALIMAVEAFGAFGAFATPPGAELWAVLGAAILVAAAGLWDDITPLAAGPRLAAQVLAAALVVAVCGGFARLPLPPPLDWSLGGVGVALAIIWIVGATNFFNFMDGADGLAGGQASITFAAIAWALWPLPAAVVALISSAAYAAFLLRNWAPARIFLGDVGSGFAGFLLAALPLAAPTGRREALTLLVATSLSLFLVDPVVTLARRMVRGRPIGVAHREHAYQLLFDPAGSHATTVSLLLLAAASLTVAACITYRDPSFGWWSVAWASVVSAVEWALALSPNRRRA